MRSLLLLLVTVLLVCMSGCARERSCVLAEPTVTVATPAGQRTLTRRALLDGLRAAERGRPVLAAEAARRGGA